MRTGIDLLRQPVEGRQRISVGRQGLKRFVGPGVFHYKFKMKTLFGTRAAPFFDVSVHQLCRTGSVSLAHSPHLNRNGMGSASQQLIVHDGRPGGGDPVQRGVPGEILEGQERDPLHCRGSRTGARAADRGSQQQWEPKLPLQRTLYSAARISWNSMLSCNAENAGSALNLSRSLKPLSSALRIYCKVWSVRPALAQVLARM